VKKKYILKKGVKFKKAVSPETKRYYAALHRVNSLRLKKILRKRPKPQKRVRPSIQILLLLAIYYFLVSLVVFLQNNFSWFQR